MASSSPTNPLLSSIFSNPSSLKTQTPLLKLTNHQSLLFKTRTHFSITPPTSKLIRALEREQSTATSLLRQEQLGVAENVKVLKNAAKTRQVAASEIISALIAIEKAKVDSSEFLNTLGGSETPGRTWMLIFTAKERMESGSYFPITAVQRFDAAAKRIENGVYLGPLGSLTFEGRFSWKKRIMAFVFEYIRIKVGPFGPLQIGLGTVGDREPNTKDDPFFIWFYVDEEIAVARGRSGGTAFWCRCRRLVP
eukprot:TRINITY_DN13322_c0_g1_i2.p1 TRINITY_DN13322_c0_g1~~TRINITY_DN13322_c0_g1_i2.p1  ORF type:complete len:251 (-),score=42.27 TRINITY_DN13322_c0_g1_i2:222-974(-)